MSSLISEIKKGYNTFKVFESLLEKEEYIKNFESLVAEKKKMIETLQEEAEEIKAEKARLTKQLKAKQDRNSLKEKELENNLAANLKRLKNQHDIDVSNFEGELKLLDQKIDEGKRQAIIIGEAVDLRQKELADLLDKIKEARSVLKGMLGE